MRAAHSIKGAARIVRVDPAVEVAHAMEDYFVAAQKGLLQLTPDDVDVMLRGVDLLGRISAATKNPLTDWRSFESSVQDVVAELKRVLAGEPASRGPLAAPPGQAAAPSDQATRVPQSTAAVIAIPEVLDVAAAERARCELLAALDAGSRALRIDLAATRDLDVMGVAFLAAARRHVSAQHGASLRLHPVSAEMQTILQITGLDATARETASL